MNKRERKQFIKKLYDRSDQLTLKNRWYRQQVKRYTVDTLESDAPKDVTTKPLAGKKDQLAATVVLRETAVVAGMEEVQWAAKQLGLETSQPVKDGNTYRAGKKLLRLFGSTREILRSERMLINTLQRMSGIATQAQAMVKAAGKTVPVASTRKTLWGALDKKAAYLGGAFTHRLGLFDGVMLKDNHIQLLRRFSDIELLRFPRKLSRQVEVDTLEQLKELFELELEVDSILLDNFTPAQCKKAVQLAQRMKQHQYYIFEASGGITLDNCRSYSNTGVDIISSGALTQSAPATDISLEIDTIYTE